MKKEKSFFFLNLPLRLSGNRQGFSRLSATSFGHLSMSFKGRQCAAKQCGKTVPVCAPLCAADLVCSLVRRLKCLYESIVLSVCLSVCMSVSLSVLHTRVPTSVVCLSYTQGFQHPSTYLPQRLYSVLGNSGGRMLRANSRCPDVEETVNLAGVFPLSSSTNDCKHSYPWFSSLTGHLGICGICEKNNGTHV